MFQVEPPQQRVGSELRSPQDVAPAVRFDLGKRQELAHASVEIAPDPLVNRSKKPVYWRQHRCRGPSLPGPSLPNANARPCYGVRFPLNTSGNAPVRVSDYDRRL